MYAFVRLLLISSGRHHLHTEPSQTSDALSTYGAGDVVQR